MANHLQPLVSIVDPSVFLPVDQPASLNESSPLLFNENKKKVKLALQMIDARRSFGRHEPARSDSRVWCQDDRSKPFRLLCLMTDSPNSAGRAGVLLIRYAVSCSTNQIPTPHFRPLVWHHWRSGICQMMANARRAGSRYIPKHEGCDLVHGCWQSFQSTGWDRGKCVQECSDVVC